METQLNNLTFQLMETQLMKTLNVWGASSELVTSYAALQAAVMTIFLVASTFLITLRNVHTKD